MWDAIEDFLNKGDNTDKLIFLIIGGFIGAIAREIITRFIPWIFKLICRLINKIFEMCKKQIRKTIQNIKDKRKYNRTIRQIEKKELPIPPYFLINRSREKNPELKVIYDMIEIGELDLPKETKLAQYFQEHPIDINSITKNNLDFGISIKPPDIITYLKKDD